MSKKWQVKIGSALDYLGAATSVVKKLKYGHMPYLAKTAASFMTFQFFRLHWPTPDVIIPVPRRHLLQQTHHALLLAKNLSKFLKIPCRSLLKRDIGDFSQARLSKVQREHLPPSRFWLKKNASVEGKTLLLVDDVVTTGMTLQNCAQALAEGSPSKIYALSFARATILAN